MSNFPILDSARPAPAPRGHRLAQPRMWGCGAGHPHPKGISVTNLPNPKVMYSLASAADAVDVSVDTLRREFKASRIAFKLLGGRLFVTRGELERWAESLESATPGGAA